MKFFDKKKKVEGAVAQLDHQAEPVSRTNSLKELCAGDEENYKMMQNLVFGDVARQMPLFDVKQLSAKVDEKIAQGDKMGAMAELGTLIRIQIYNQMGNEVEKSLQKFRLLATPGTEMYKLADRALSNTDYVLEKAKLFYQGEPKKATK